MNMFFIYLTSLSLWLGILLYILAMSLSFIISRYPDPVKNQNLSDKLKAKLVLRKFFRGLFCKYFIMAFGCLFLVKHGFSFSKIFIGVAIALFIQRIVFGLIILLVKNK